MDDQHKSPTEHDAEGWLEVVRRLRRIEARLDSALRREPVIDLRAQRGRDAVAQRAQVAN